MVRGIQENYVALRFSEGLMGSTSSLVKILSQQGFDSWGGAC